MKLDVDRLRNEQAEIARRIRLQPKFASLGCIQTVAAADVSCSRFSKTGYAAVVMFSFPALRLLQEGTAVQTLDFPYVPGYLAYREAPLIDACLAQFKERPDVLVCDGQGIAHPRGAGIASHIGVEHGLVTVGCGKSRLVGEFVEPGRERGARSDLMHHDQKIGEVLRTRSNVKPLFISPGHQIDFEQATALILALCPRFRQPEPIRAAHKRVNRMRANALSS